MKNFLLLSSFLYFIYGFASLTHGANDLPTSSKIQEFIQKAHDSATVDDFFADLPQEYKDNFTLISDSESLRMSCFSKEYPRILSFSLKDKVIIAGGGNPKNPNCDALEFVGLADTNEDWHIEDISWPRFPEVSSYKKVDRQTCIFCHSTPTHPVWQDDSPWTVDPSDDLSAEVESHKRYNESWKTLPIYKHLNWSKGPLYPFSPEEKENLAYQPRTPMNIFMAIIQNRVLALKFLNTSFGAKNKYYYLAQLIENPICNKLQLKDQDEEEPVFSKLENFTYLGPESPQGFHRRDYLKEINDYIRYFVGGIDSPRGGHMLNQLLHLVFSSDKSLKNYLEPANKSHFSSSNEANTISNKDFAKWATENQPQLKTLSKREKNRLCQSLKAMHSNL